MKQQHDQSNLRIMKTSIRLLFLFIFMSFLGIHPSAGQEEQPQNSVQSKSDKRADRKAQKLKRKAVQDSIAMMEFQKAWIGLEDTTFVLESNTVYDKKGNSMQVSESTNFIQVNKNEVTVQLSFPFVVNGPNGIGGITLEGRLTRYNIKKTKKGAYYVELSSFGSSLNADITINISPGSNRATATVSASTLPYRVRYDGSLYHIKESGVFKGRTIF